MSDQPEQRLIPLFKALPGIRKVWLFGSRARGDHKPGSDIDLAVSCEAEAFSPIWSAIDGNDLTLHKVDIVHYETASDDLLQEIKHQGKILYDRDKT